MYLLKEQIPEIDDYLRLRKESGLSQKTKTAAQTGLPNSIYSVIAETDNHEIVAMGRIIGDGGCCFVICDIAVLPEHQGNGLGRLIMEKIMDYINKNAPSSAYVELIADVPEFYEKLGFKRCAPEAEGMYIRI
jgi:ribosomal protein S18 acetylase RimI-like enzyme